MPKLRIARRAWADLLDVKAHTLERFGAAKLIEYETLIEDALEAIAADPTCGKPRAKARSGIRAYHIAKPGRRARHMFFYRMLGLMCRDAALVTRRLGAPTSRPQCV